MVGVIKFFFKNNCPRCPQAKQVGDGLKVEGFNVIEYDLDTADGLAEASFYSIQSTPTFILEDLDENPVADFRGDIPTMQQIKELMAGA